MKTKKGRRFTDFYQDGDIMYCLDIDTFGEILNFRFFSKARGREMLYSRIWKINAGSEKFYEDN